VYESLARQHNALGLTTPLPDTASPFWSRPFNVIHGDRFAAALLDRIDDADLKRLAQTPVGSVDQISDNVDALENTPRRAWKRFYQHEDSP
jgi:hypothetical protein